MERISRGESEVESDSVKKGRSTADRERLTAVKACWSCSLREFGVSRMAVSREVDESNMIYPNVIPTIIMFPYMDMTLDR